MNREEAVTFLKEQPCKFGWLLGFNKLGSLHNSWIKEMVRGRGDKTLQASRGTYKTTCDSIALALLIILLPNLRTMFMRKTDTDVKEVLRQVQKILQDPHTNYLVQCIYGVNLQLGTKSTQEVSTNLSADIKGTSQLIGVGTGGSLTGKHFDRIFTDDIVNVQDRVSKAERERTRMVYQELQNIKNPGGRIFNTGTPWHEEDCFAIMPPAEKYDCYHPEVQKIITAEELENRKKNMLPSLFAANYELRFIPSEDVIFTDPKTGEDPAKVQQGWMQVDSAFYGSDYTAWTVMRKQGGKYYVYGRIARKHVEECYDAIAEDYKRFMCGKLFNEDNADKGMVGKDLRKHGMKVILYHEQMNKYLKIVTYLKAVWKDLYFVDGTDPEYIRQITDYYEDAEHDDAPDSAASLARLLYTKKEETYRSLWM